MMIYLPRYALAMACAAAVAVTPLLAQSSSEVNAGSQFDFGSPGARSLGLGGAFVGVADDATAVFTNPAGLTNLLKTEAALELRGFSNTTTFTDTGRGSGVPTGTLIDKPPHLIDGESTRRLAALSFGSLVVPTERWSFALYRRDLAHFHSFTRAQGAFYEKIVFKKPQTGRLLPTTNEMSLGVASYGASVAARLTERFSVGLSLERRAMRLDSQTTRYDFSSTAVDPVYAPADFKVPLEFQTQHGRDSDWALHAGLLWTVNRRLVFGAALQQGSAFHVTVKRFAPDVDPRDTEPLDGTFQVPSVYRAGVSYGIGETGKLSLEVDRIRYSRLAEGFVRLYGETARYRADDGTEIHLGFQRLLLNDFVLDHLRFPLVVSVGAWRDPDHRVRYEDSADVQAILFRRGKDEYHGSVGVALAMGEAHEIGIAYDYSRRQRTLSASVVARF